MLFSLPYLLQSERSKGFSLLEVLIAIGILATIAGVSTPFLRTLLLQSNQEAVIQSLSTFIFQAQQFSLHKKADLNWGVCLQNDEIWLFSDSCSPSNKYSSYQLPTGTTISSFTELQFDDRGELTADQTMLITSASTTTQLTVNQLGVVNEE